MEVYERETKEVVIRFLSRKLIFPACIAALDASLSRLISEMRPAQQYELRDIMLANNEKVMNEMARREIRRA